MEMATHHSIEIDPSNQAQNNTSEPVKFSHQNEPKTPERKVNKNVKMNENEHK